MSSTIKVNNIQNLAGDDSGIDLSTNDQIILKTANTSAITIDSSQVATFSQIPSGTFIAMADQWRNTTDLTADTDPITTLERVDEASSGIIGTGMTETSGEFTFPTTGIYFITMKVGLRPNNDVNMGVYAYVDTGSGYDLYDVVEAGITSGENRSYGYGSLILDVTNTSTHKIKFSVVGMTSGCIVFGNTNYNRTAFTFIRLGNT